MGGDRELLGHFAVAENLDHVEAALGQALCYQHFDGDGGAGIEGVIDGANINFGNADGEFVVVESAFSHPAEERHLAPFVAEVTRVTSTTLRPLVSATRGLTVTGADASTNTLARFLSVNALMDVIDHHN